MKRTSRTSLLLLAIGMAIGSLSAGAPKDLTLTFKFVPQEATGASAPALGEEITSRPVALKFEDKRTPSEGNVIGEFTDDEKKLTWKAAGSVGDYAKEVFVKTAGEWGIKLQDGADQTLFVHLTKFYIGEKDQAMGSTYAAQIRVTFELKDRNGSLLGSGTGSGDASRYGRKHSTDNCNEVLSDALKEAYSNLFDNPSLQAGWSGKAAPAQAAKVEAAKGKPMSPSELLAELTSLQKQGFNPDMLAKYVSQQTLSAPLSAQDMADFKKAGIPDAVIQATLDRAAGK
jgi:hypothetical protein